MDNFMRKYILVQMQQMCTERNIFITENGMLLYKYVFCIKFFFDGDNVRVSTSVVVERVMARYIFE